MNTQKRERAGMYLRISQDREGTEFGVDRQREECQALAKRLGLDIVDEFMDNDRGASTRSRKRRPQYERMMADLDSGRFTVVISYSMSRLTRRPREGEGLLERAERGALTIKTVASGDPDLTRADGRATFRTLMAWDAAEAERIGERVAAAARQRAERGGFGGGARRFGYTSDASALIPEEAEALAFAYHLVAAGGTLEAVVRDWRGRGLTGPQGGRLTGIQVRDCLLRPMNAGLSQYRGEIIGNTDADTPAIIDVETFHIVRETLLDPARRTTVGRPAATMLAPVLRCSVCGGRVSGASRNHGKGHLSQRNGRTPTYACRERHVSRVRGPLDALVGDLVVEYLVLNAATLAKPVPGRPSAAADEAAKLRDRLDRLARLAASGDLEPEDFAAASKALRASLAAAEAQVVTEARRTATVALVGAEDVRAAWEAMTTEGRRAVVVEVIDTITMGPGRSGKFTPEGLVVKWRA